MISCSDVSKCRLLRKISHCLFLVYPLLCFLLSCGVWFAVLNVMFCWRFVLVKIRVDFFLVASLYFTLECPFLGTTCLPIWKPSSVTVRKILIINLLFASETPFFVTFPKTIFLIEIAKLKHSTSLAS